MSSLNRWPYFDDFQTSKNYHKIVFVPGNPVQARELTQIQTILQEQIKRHGDHIFKNGTVVLPGHVYFDNKTNYIKVDTSYNGVNVESYKEFLIGKTLVGGTSGVQALVQHVEVSTSSDPVTIFFKYTSGNGAISTFANNEVLTETTTNLQIKVQASSTYTGIGSICTIDEGVYYINGYFAGVNRQTIAVSKYSSVSSNVVGLMYNEIIVTSADDSTLYDNSNGFSNFGAPGADRLQINLVLSSKPYDYVEDESDTDLNFIEILKIKDGNIEYKLENTEYSHINKMLARRTFDESGNYVVDDFDIKLTDYRSNNTGQWLEAEPYLAGDIVSNAGIYYYCRVGGYSGSTAPTHTYGTSSDGSLSWTQTPAPTFNTGIYVDPDGATLDEITENESKYSVTLSNGRAYVNGYEVSVNQSKHIFGNKSREEKQVSNTSLFTPVGEYVIVTNLLGILNTSTLTQVNILDSVGATVGSAYAKSIEYHSGTVGTSAAQYKLFLFGVVMNANKSFDNNAITLSASGFSATTVLYNTALSGLITTTSSSASVTGKGTLFQTELSVGQLVKIGSETKVVQTITSNTALTTTATFSNSNTDTAGYLTQADIVSTGPIIKPLDNNFIKSVRNAANTIDMRYTVVRYKRQAASGGSLTLTLTAPGESFTSSLASDFIVAADSTTPVAITTSAATATSITIDGLSGSTTYNILYQVTKVASAAAEKTKTLNTKTITVNSGTIKDELDSVTLMTAPSTSISGSVSTNIITVGSATGLYVGMAVAGTGVAPNAYILNISGTTVTLSAVNTGSVSGTGVFTFFDGRSIPLTEADVIRIVKITMSGGAVGASYSATNEVDITSWFTVDSGQRPDFYDIGSLKLRPGQPIPKKPIKVSFEYFDHSPGDYFSVDSYKYIPYSMIPSATFNGVYYELRDCLDFRSRKSDDGTSFTGSGATISEAFLTTSSVQTSYSYYLPRIDVLTLSQDGTFQIIEGISAPNPVEPKLPSSVLKMLTIDVEAYTMSPETLRLNKTANKRYTMADIGNLENRISNVEFYVALSELEKNTTDLNVVDSAGLTRYKNGFFADDFTDFATSDVGNSDLKYNINSDDSSAGPAVVTNNISVYEIEGTTVASRLSNGYQVTGSVISLPYTEATLIEQSSASRSEFINPYSVISFKNSGIANVYPISDQWTDVKTDYNELWLAATTIDATIKLKCWNRYWSPGGDGYNYLNFGARSWQNGYFTIGGGSQVWVPEQNRWIQSWDNNATSSTTTTKVVSSSESVTSSQELAQMRSRSVGVALIGMKPFTNFHGYMDESSIDSIITPASTLRFSSAVGSFKGWADTSKTAESLAKRVTTVNSYDTIDYGDVLTFSNGASAVVAARLSQVTGGVTEIVLKLVNVKGTITATNTFIGSISGATGVVTSHTTETSLTTNSTGAFYGILNFTNKFTTGNKVLKFNDGSGGDSDLATTEVKTNFVAHGTLNNKTVTQTKQNTTKVTGFKWENAYYYYPNVSWWGPGT